jgi:HD-GYP domain-containing protein (c-di-GMP phosphodiesterase class II)
MAVEEVRLNVNELQPGMFVCRLDGLRWEDTPFPLQGVMVRTVDDIIAVRKHSDYVFIDRIRSVHGTPDAVLMSLDLGGAGSRLHTMGSAIRYTVSASLDEELPRITFAAKEAQKLSRRLTDDLREGRKLSIDEINSAIEPVVASIVRNPDAYFWLSSLRERDPYAYSHAVNCAALMSAFGRQLGFPGSTLVELASAGMLMDLGMAALPEGTVNHALALSESQQQAMRGHIEASLAQLDAAAGSTPLVRSAIEFHHERHDGSGYPNGRRAFEIPLEARMLGIVDTFDAMSSVRAHQPAAARHHVLQALYRERDRLFQAELVEQFSQSIGVYPTGSLVELSSGEVAVVTAQNSARRLMPKVTVLTRPDKTVDSRFRKVDLWQQVEADGPRLTIHRALQPGAYGLDLTEFFI